MFVLTSKLDYLISSDFIDLLILLWNKDDDGFPYLDRGQGKHPTLHDRWLLSSNQNISPLHSGLIEHKLTAGCCSYGQNFVGFHPFSEFLAGKKITDGSKVRSIPNLSPTNLEGFRSTPDVDFFQRHRPLVVSAHSVRQSSPLPFPANDSKRDAVGWG